MEDNSFGFSSPRPTRRQLGLRWRIVALLLLVSLLPLGLVGVGSWVVFGRLAVNRTMELQRSLVRAHAAAIDLYLEERLRALEVVARRNSRDDLARENGARLRQLFQALSVTYPGAFVDLGVIDADGAHLAYVGPHDLGGLNYAGAGWFRAVQERGGYVSDVFLGYRRVPHCVVAVKGRARPTRSWILRATINSETFHALVRAHRVGRTGEAFIVDARGRYQTPPQAGQVLEQSPLAPAVHAGVMERTVGPSGRRKLRVTTWINDRRWMLVVQQDEAEVRAPVNRATAWGALFIALALVLVAAATVFATWHLTGRIDRATRQRDELHRDLLRSAKLASLGELATGLAHEINNPLAVISADQTNIADQIARFELRAEDRERLMRSVARCQRQVERCSAITSKMLQFGRSDSLRPVPCDLEPLLRETAALLERQAKVQNIDLLLEVEAELPRVVVDPTELEQVVVNLVRNAMDAIRDAGAITVSARRDDGAVALAVADTGSGIPPEDLDRVFQPFFTTKPVGQGTGLGLSVCYGIVRGWGGTIEAASEPGAGTTMTIHLPIPRGTALEDPWRQKKAS